MNVPPYLGQRCSRRRARRPNARRTPCRTGFRLPSCTQFGTSLGTARLRSPRSTCHAARRPAALREVDSNARPNRPPSPHERKKERVVDSGSFGNWRAKKAAGCGPKNWERQFEEQWIKTVRMNGSESRGERADRGGAEASEVRQ